MTFGPGEEEVVSAVDTEDGLAVALGHVDTLQRRRATAFGGRDRVDDTPGRQTDRQTRRTQECQQVQGGRSTLSAPS